MEGGSEGGAEGWYSRPCKGGVTAGGDPSALAEDRV